MAQKNATVFEVPDMKGKGLGLYDNRHPKGKSVKAKKVVDITTLRREQPECRALLMYATTVRGRLVQVHDCYPNEDFGMHTHFYFDESGTERDEIASRVGGWFGLKLEEMLGIIQQYAPKK